VVREVSLPPLSEGRRVAVVEADDRIYVAGPTRDGEINRAKLWAFELDLDYLWEAENDSPLWSEAAGLAAGEGLVVVTASILDDQQIVNDTSWMAFDPDGDLVWQSGEPIEGLDDTYCGPSYPDGLNRSGSCLAMDAQGSTYLSGSDWVDETFYGGYALRTVKLDASGLVDWTRVITDESPDFSNGATASVLGPDANLHVVSPALLAVSYDGEGNQLSLASRAGVIEVKEVVTDSSGAFYAAGSSQFESTAPVSGGSAPMTTPTTYSIDVVLVKYFANGTESWSRTYAGPGGGEDRALAAITTAADHVVLVGQASYDSGLHALVRAYDTDGEVAYTGLVEPADGPSGSAAFSAVALAGAGLVAAGRTTNGTDVDALVARVDASGNVLWRNELDGDLGEDVHGDDEADAVAVDPAGNTYIAGHTWNGGDFDVLVAKLDPGGNEVWRRAIDFGHGNDEAWSAAFDGPGPGGADGSLWIAGRASNGNDTDALTMRFDPDGNELYRALVAGTEERDDEHYDLVVGPPGHATVAGISAEIDESYNFQAIRYVIDPLDVDYDGESEAFADGLLVLRSLFGFEGAALTLGAVDADCERCSAESIDVHVRAISKLLDIDGNGSTEPLTDGLLCFRWQLGFRGETLTAGAVDLEDCTRCDAAAIEAYLSGLNG
jgi:hypothetical protein